MIKWHEVTWYSRLCAIVLFIGIIPALAFFIGTQYESTLAILADMPSSAPVVTAPSQDANQPTALYVDPTIDKNLQDCLNVSGGSNDGTDNCLVTESDSYDAVESVDYKQALQSIETLYSPPGTDPYADTTIYYTDAKKNLPQAEKAWETYQNAICAVETDMWTNGTGSSIASNSCYLMLTQEHIQDLLNIGPGVGG